MTQAEPQRIELYFSSQLAYINYTPGWAWLWHFLYSYSIFDSPLPSLVSFPCEDPLAFSQLAPDLPSTYMSISLCVTQCVGLGLLV